MRYHRLPKFVADWDALSSTDKATVRHWLAAVFLPAVAAYEENPAGFVWPHSLRFERLRDTTGICAVTWSFAGPDGRATFRLLNIDGQPYLEWRRIGRHEFYRHP